MPTPLPPIDAHYHGPRPRVSVVILTLNEQINILACLASCAWSDDVHLLDSGSTDQTVALARAAGATTWHNPFAGFGQQRNWAIDNIPLKHDWVFHLDADERFTEPLVREISQTLDAAPPHAGYFCANQMILMNRWIKRSSGYPAYQVRLFHKHRLRFSDHGHGQREQTAGTLATLKHPYVHHNFSKGLSDWLVRHDRYSTKEAQLAIAQEQDPAQGLLGPLLTGPAIQRRRALKRLVQRVPCRGTLRFWHTLVLQRGLLDGGAGVQYARLMAIYETMIALKIAELHAASKVKPATTPATTPAQTPTIPPAP
jgi:hypothetical protein